MSAFIDYARYYDLIYQDKNYGLEAGFVMDRLAAVNCRPRDILELGCGTGRHAAELAKRGCNVYGIDASERMVGIARERMASSRLRFEVGNIQTWRNEARFDAALSLFHVISYQKDYVELAGAIETAHFHLRPDGVFFFDFWYGPAVLTTPPTVRVRRFDGGDIEVFRISQPHQDPNENRVVVDYTVLVVDKQQRASSEFQESHTLRYWFLPELNLMLNKGGFQIEQSGRWETSEPLSSDSWYGYVVARKAHAKD